MKKQDQRMWILLLCAFTNFLFLCVGVVFVFFQKPNKVAEANTIKEQYESCQNESQQLREQTDQMKHIQPLWLERDSGFQVPFHDFVMSINAEFAGLDSPQEQLLEDKKFYDATLTCMNKIRSYKDFWQNIKQAKKNCAYVTSEMRQAKLPEVFTAIPFQETQYDSTLQSSACAKGMWQFMPKTGYRMGLEIKNCKYKMTLFLHSLQQT